MSEITLTKSRKYEVGIERSPNGSDKKLSQELLARLESLGFAVESHPKSEKFRLIYKKTGLVLGVRGFIWEKDEIIRMVEILEQYESQDSQSQSSRKE